MTPPRKLHIVPFKGDQAYGQNILNSENMTVLKDAESINAAVSLYFQWEAKRKTFVHFVSRKNTFPCNLDYDRDEIEPTELRLSIPQLEEAINVVPGASIIIRFELFRTAYEFASEVTAVANDPKIEGWHAVIAPPDEVKVTRARSLPRLQIKEQDRGSLPRFEWAELESQSKIQLKILELGLTSLRVSCSVNFEIGQNGYVFVGEKLKIPTQVVRVTSKFIVFKFVFKDTQIFQSYFDIYRRLAFPFLKSRYELPYEAGLKLYSDSNYFGTFKAEKSPREKEELVHAWELIKDGFHKTNADYYVTDDRGKPIGCSGLALSHYIGEEPAWSFHQLCAIKDPQNIERSGVLYTWRSQYLLARPGSLQTWGSFRSTSRWLERIYVKHTMLSSGGSKLFPIVMTRVDTKATPNKVDFPFIKYKVGKAERVCSKSTDLWMGANPKFLNASGNLDTVVCFSSSVSSDKLLDLGAQLAKEANRENLDVSFIAPYNFPVQELGGTLLVQDRLVQIPKKDLISFESSVEYSMAVTERKLSHAPSDG